MDGITKILIVENNPVDIELIQYELKNGGINFISEIVQNEPDYVNALERFTPHLILSDFVLPHFDGDTAFEIRKRLVPETPFVFISGTIGEERSVEYIKNGVTDYVLKDNLISLAVKVKRALRDVEERQQKKIAEEDLKKSEKLFRALIEKSKDMITLGNRKGELVYGSPFITDALGYSPEDLINMRLYDVVHPEDIPQLRASRHKLLNTPGGSFNFQHRRRHKNGNWVWCEGTVTNLLDEPGINAMLTNFRDISARKKAEHDLLVSNGNLQKVLNDLQKTMNASLDMICSMDADGRFATVSPASERILGFRPDELIGRKYIELVFEEDVESTNNLAAEIMNGHEVNFFENRYLHKNGTIIPVMWSATWDNADKLMYCVAKDITEKKIVEKRLFDSELGLKQAQAIAQMGNFESDVKNRSDKWSDQMYSILGLDKDEVTPSREVVLSFIHPDDVDVVGKEMEESLKTGNDSISTFRFIRKDDSLRYGYVKAMFDVDANGAPTRVFGIFQDVTERKLAEIERERLVNDLMLRNAELEQFAYVASHDLQEPLRMVTSFLTQLEKKYSGVLDERGRKYIYFAVDGAKRMRQIILDLLDFSRVGKTEHELEDVDFNNLVKEILALYRRRIEESKARVTFKNLPTIRSYKTPLRQVFQNLISNSLKYQKPGIAPLINITCTETKACYQFAVKDNGIGIAPEYLNRIFIIFQRLHNKDEYSGTGIGLAIVKKIVENMGGKIWAESAEGEGATFYFTILKQSGDERD